MSFLHTLKQVRSVVRKEIFLFFLLLIVIVALAYSVWSFQRQLSDAQKQTFDLQNQLTYYENLTDTLQTQVSNLQAQLNDLKNPIYNVTIANISSTSWGNPVGMTRLKQFSITVKNIGVRDVGGLTAEFKILADGYVTDNDDFEVTLVDPQQVGVLNVQESMVMKVDVLSSFYVSFAGKSLVVTLMLDKTVLDERTLPLV
jgi:cell division protein FtsL